MNLSQWCRLLCHADFAGRSPLQLFEQTVCKVVVMNKVSLLVQMEMNLRCFFFSEPNWEVGGFETAYRPNQFDGKSQFFECI